ncbi:MAG: helix-turn-helix domain-containing protein [Clostridiales bacterium]|nr:helix-turn-helix domain-containing protein [Clostridiales bacterium]
MQSANRLVAETQIIHIFIAKTAEALLIHRSSLLKRLDKIYRLLCSTLDTPEERLYLRLCLELLQRTNREAL